MSCSVDHIETRDPAGDHAGEQPDAGAGEGLRRDRDRGGDRTEAEARSQPDMAEPGEPLEEAVARDPREDRSPEDGRPPVAEQHPEGDADRQEEHAAEQEGPHRRAERETTRWNRSSLRSRVPGIDPVVEDAIGQHRGGTGEDHGDHHQDERRDEAGPVDGAVTQVVGGDGGGRGGRTAARGG